jgi:hypothetical protein
MNDFNATLNSLNKRISFTWAGVLFRWICE